MTRLLRLVIHAPTAAALERALSNARNLQLAEPSAEIEIVLNAGAVQAALAEPSHLFEAAGRVLVCRNTLDRLELRTPANFETIDAAVLHIARRQAEGWAYMRA